MGAYTSPNQVWYPDLTDVGQPNVWAATLAQSVDAGIGARLQKQEVAVGLKASLTDNALTFTATSTIVPYTVNSGIADFNNGFTLAGGVATVNVKGMYVVTASVSGHNGTSRGLKILLYQNAIAFAQAEVPQQASGGPWINSQASCVLNCAIGDTIYAKVQLTGSAGTDFNVQPAGNYISVAMVQAVP
jgi:hypothetical protein